MNEPKVCCLHQKEKFVSGLTKPVPKNTIEIVLKGKWLAYKYTYAGTFEGNILVVGQTGCGKTTFIQILAKNHMFGDLKEIF